MGHNLLWEWLSRTHPYPRKCNTKGSTCLELLVLTQAGSLLLPLHTHPSPHFPSSLSQQCYQLATHSPWSSWRNDCAASEDLGRAGS